MVVAAVVVLLILVLCCVCKGRRSKYDLQKSAELEMGVKIPSKPVLGGKHIVLCFCVCSCVSVCVCGIFSILSSNRPL